MGEFLEERISVQIRYDNTYQDDYAVEITQTGGSNDTKASEYRRLIHPYPVRRFSVAYQLDRDECYADILALYHRAYGKFSGFRAKNFDDYTTAANHRAAPSATDQALALVSAGVYQLQKKYGTDKVGIAVGYPVRILYKPVANTTLVAVGGVSVPVTAMWTVDTTTGRITFAANKSKAVTGITQAASAVVTVGSHTYAIGESVHFGSVAGMTQINGLRGTVTATGASTITVNINSTGFSGYTSGGTVNTNPQTGETVTGGCEFDFPVRFDSSIPVNQNHRTSRFVEFDLVELLNP